MALMEHVGLWDEASVCVELLKGLYLPSVCDEPTAREKWEALAADPSRVLYDGRCLRQLSATSSPTSVRFICEETSYRAFLATNMAASLSVNPKERADPIAVCATVVTADGCVLVGLRGGAVVESSRKWHVPAGTIEILGLLPRGEGGEGYSPFETMRRELEEELGLRREDIEGMKCIGVGRTTSNMKPECLFLAGTSLGAEEVKKRWELARDKDEHVLWELVPKESVEIFVSTHDMSPIGALCLRRANELNFSV